MKLDGLTPSKGTDPLDRLSGKAKAKAEPKAGGKSFADALGKAQGGPPPAPAGQAPVESSAPSVEPSAPPPMESHMDTIRFRLQSGYYNNPKVDDELSDKLSGFFDEIA